MATHLSPSQSQFSSLILHQSSITVFHLHQFNNKRQILSLITPIRVSYHYQKSWERCPRNSESTAPSRLSYIRHHQVLQEHLQNQRTHPNLYEDLCFLEVCKDFPMTPVYRLYMLNLSRGNRYQT